MKGRIYSKDYRYLTGQLKKSRKEAKLTQNQVAEYLGYSQSYISKVGMGQPGLDILQVKNLPAFIEMIQTFL